MSSSSDENAVGRARRVRPRWGHALLVCGKCLKRHEDGKSLRRALKAEIKLAGAKKGKHRRIRILKTACVGLCPGRAIVVASAATLATGEVILVRDSREIPDAMTRLLPGEPSA